MKGSTVDKLLYFRVLQQECTSPFESFKQLRIHVQQYSLPSSNTGLIGNTVIQKYYDPKLPNDQCNLTALWTRPAELYNLLYRLGSNTKDKFEVAKLLRSNMTSLALLYLMYRYTVDNLTNHTVLRPRHWWQRPLNSKADTNHPPMSRCNYTHWALHTTRHTKDGYVNFYMNIRAFFLGFTFRPLPSFTRNIFDHQDIFLPRYWKYFPKQHFLIWIYRIAHGHHRNNGWNKDKRLSTNGNNDGDFQTNFRINGIYIFTSFGKNMNATSSSMQMTAPIGSNASHKKFECSKDMYFAQEIITPTRPSLPARATTITCWRRPTLKLMFSNSVP